MTAHAEGVLFQLLKSAMIGRRFLDDLGELSQSDFRSVTPVVQYVGGHQRFVKNGEESIEVHSLRFSQGGFRAAWTNSPKCAIPLDKKHVGCVGKVLLINWAPSNICSLVPEVHHTPKHIKKADM